MTSGHVALVWIIGTFDVMIWTYNLTKILQALGH